MFGAWPGCVNAEKEVAQIPAVSWWGTARCGRGGSGCGCARQVSVDAGHEVVAHGAQLLQRRVRELVRVAVQHLPDAEVQCGVPCDAECRVRKAPPCAEGARFGQAVARGRVGWSTSRREYMRLMPPASQ